MSFLTLSASFQKGNSSSSSSSFFCCWSAAQRQSTWGGVDVNRKARDALLIQVVEWIQFPSLLLAFYSSLLLLSAFRTVGSGERIKSRTQRRGRERMFKQKRRRRRRCGSGWKPRRANITPVIHKTEKKEEKKNQGFPLGFLLNIF